MRELSKSEQRKTNGGATWCVRFNAYLGSSVGHSPAGTTKIHTDYYLGKGSSYGGSTACPYAYGK